MFIMWCSLNFLYIILSSFVVFLQQNISSFVVFLHLWGFSSFVVFSSFLFFSSFVVVTESSPYHSSITQYTKINKYFVFFYISVQ